MIKYICNWIKCKEKSVNYKRKRKKLSMQSSRQQGVAPNWFWSIFLLTFISQSQFFIIWEICIVLLSAFVFPRFHTVLIKNCAGTLRQCVSNFFSCVLLTFKINTIYHNQYLLNVFALVHLQESIPSYIQLGGPHFHLLLWLRR